MMAAETRQLWLLAGGNGAGKSTFYRLFLAPKGIRLVNADLIAKAIDSQHPENVSYEAAGMAERFRNSLVEKGVSFCYETVFSHVSKVDFVAKAKAAGYVIILVYVHLESGDLNAARVSQRVAEGGHNVPVEKIYKRIPRAMENVAAVLPLVDEARLLDNSFKENPFQQIAIVKKGRQIHLMDPLPAWAASLLDAIAR